MPKSLKKCRTILPFSCCPLVFLWKLFQEITDFDFSLGQGRSQGYRVWEPLRGFRRLVAFLNTENSFWESPQAPEKPLNTSMSEKSLNTLTLLFSLLFSISLLFSFSDFLAFFFAAFFLPSPRIVGVPRREKPLPFSGFPLLFFFKKQGLEGQGTRGFARQGGFQKGGFGGCSPVPNKPERGYIRMFPWYQEPERGYIRMFPGTKNRKEGTFAKTTLFRNRLFVSSRNTSTVIYLQDVLSTLL